MGEMSQVWFSLHQHQLPHHCLLHPGAEHLWGDRDRCRSDADSRSLVAGRHPHWLGDGQVLPVSEGSEQRHQVLRESRGHAKVLACFVCLSMFISCRQGGRGVIPRGQGGRPGCQPAGQGELVQPFPYQIYAF